MKDTLTRFESLLGQTPTPQTYGHQQQMFGSILNEYKKMDKRLAWVIDQNIEYQNKITRRNEWIARRNDWILKQETIIKQLRENLAELGHLTVEQEKIIKTLRENLGELGHLTN